MLLHLMKYDFLFLVCVFLFFRVKLLLTLAFNLQYLQNRSMSLKSLLLQLIECTQCFKKQHASKHKKRLHSCLDYQPRDY